MLFVPSVSLFSSVDLARVKERQQKATKKRKMTNAFQES